MSEEKDMFDLEQDEIEPEEEKAASGPSGPLSIEMPAAQYIIDEARRLAVDRNIRVTDLATCVSQDPILILELLRVANSIHFIQDRPAITTAQTAVVHLGSRQVLEVIDKVQERQEIADTDTSEVFEDLRNQAQRISIVARMLANGTRKDLSAEAQTTALMAVLGHMMACYYFGTDYVQLARNNVRTKVVYRLANNYNFDVRYMQLAYLRRCGFPEVIAFALDRDTTCTTPWRQPLRYLVQSATELVQAHEMDRLDRYKPGVNLPTKSALRLLQMGDLQYEKVFERCNDFLEKIGSSKEESDQPDEQANEQDLDSIDINSPLGDLEFPNVMTFEEGESSNDSGSSLAGLVKNKTGAEVKIEKKSDRASNSLNDALFSSDNKPDFNRHEEFSIDDPPEDFRYSRQAQWVMDEFGGMCVHAEEPRDLIEEVVDKLIEKGPFERAALLELSEDRRSALVIHSTSDGLAVGSTILLSDPLSPLVACRSQVKSFNSQGG